MASAAQAKAADDALNLAYRKALTFLASPDNYSTVKPEDCRNAQRAWVVYRDAFMAFAKIAAPNTSPRAGAGLLTQQRSKDLAVLGH